MPKTLEGKIIGKGKKIGIVVSRFNEFISSKLLGGALDCFQRHEVKDSDIDVVVITNDEIKRSVFDITGNARANLCR